MANVTRPEYHYPMNRYVVAVKRELWGKTQLAEALDRLRSIPGYRVIGNTEGRRTIIEATEPAFKSIESALNGVCYVEPEIEHIAQGFPRR